MKLNERWRFFEKRDELPAGWVVGIRVAFLFAAAFLGCVLVELPWREGFDVYDPTFFFCNVGLCGFVLAAAYLAGQRTRGSIVVFLGLCLAAGAALHFVVEFKGQVILPADVAAVGTALSVSQGYFYEIDERLWACIGLFAAYCVALAVLCPRVSLHKRGRIASVAAAVGLVVAGVATFSFVQIDETLHFEVSNWAPQASYERYGALLSFVTLAQDARMPAPAGYSAERAREILSAYQDERAGWLALEDEDGLSTGQPPTVVVIMNESFADLSVLESDVSEALIPAACGELTAESMVGGAALASVYGGGTCNSEFEFLTGTSMAFQAGGYYPYMFQDFSQVDSLPRYFQSLGYATVAMHPNWSTNWKRDQVYPALGFDEFLDIEDWEESERVRGEVRDSELYKTILQYIDNATAPQFIFAITMANHGGYDREVEEEYRTGATDGLEGELGVYADLVQLADADLGEFAAELQKCDTPIVLCFFGDHQPRIPEVFLQDATNEASGDMLHGVDLTAVERYYEVPYFIWGNNAQRIAREGALEETGVESSQDGGQEPSSLCYLSAQLVQESGLPQTPFMQLTNAVRLQYPLFNALGYYDGNSWLPYSVAETTPKLLNEYSIASYSLFAR